MTEAEFAARATRYLLAYGNIVLRVCDRAEARNRQYGLRIEGIKPPVTSSGPDYLVLRSGDIPVVRTSSMQDVTAWAKAGRPFFLELKAPGAVPQKQEAQDRWIHVVGG